MDARELRKQAEKTKTRAGSLWNDVDRVKVNVSGLKSRGAEDDVRVEEKRAVELEQQARALEQQAEALESDALEKERRAQEIERQQEAVKKETQAKLDELEKQKRDLTGGPIGLFG
jgi:hypothetical protein